jgi:hypothetical protein
VNRANALQDSTGDSMIKGRSGDDHRLSRLTSMLDRMSGEREELRRLVEQLPDDQVPAALAEVRRLSVPEAVSEWPPSWFNSFASGRRDLGTNHDDLLAEGFGRP